MSPRDRFFTGITWIAGALILLAVFCLPVTSLPVLSRLMGGTVVAPPSVVLAGLALVIWLPVWLARGQLLPREFAPLAAFLAAVLVSCLLSFFWNMPAYKQISSLREMISALLSLVIGITSYMAFSLWGEKKERFTWVLRLLNIGGAFMLLWSFAQLYVMFFRAEEYPGWMLSIQEMVSIGSLYSYSYLHRANGFAFEPSWLANQLNVLYLPYWLAATITGYSAFRRRIGRISLENLLLVGGLAAMLGSMSRIGILTLLLVAAYLVLCFTRFLARRLGGRFSRPRLATVLISAGLFLLYGVLAFTLIYAMSRVDVRLALIFNMQKIPSDWFALAMNLAFAERITYWAMGFTTFGQHPLFGIGLGNAGFFFHQALPARAPILMEVIKVTMQFSTLPNVKSLWMRLLGETGLVGFGLYVSWMVVLWGSAKFLQGTKDILLRTVGWMGLLVLVAQVGEGFSIDSFALPYAWVALGLLTAASLMARRKI